MTRSQPVGAASSDNGGIGGRFAGGSPMKGSTVPACLSDLTCARCSEPMAKAPGSLPQGSATCRSCRRSIRADRAAHAAGSPKLRPCRSDHCGRSTSWPWAYCERCREDRAAKPRRLYAGVCALCARQFVTTDPRKNYCGRQCANAAEAHLRSAAARWCEASVFSGDLQSGRLFQGPPLELTEVLLVEGAPMCPRCSGRTSEVTPYGDSGCAYCFVKIVIV